MFFLLKAHSSDQLRTKLCQTHRSMFGRTWPEGYLESWSGFASNTPSFSRIFYEFRVFISIFLNIFFLWFIDFMASFPMILQNTPVFTIPKNQEVFHYEPSWMTNFHYLKLIVYKGSKIAKKNMYLFQIF